MGTLCLAIGTFLNPFGFDILVYSLTQLTHDYWNTMYVLYGFAVVFFGLSYVLFKLGYKTLGNISLTIALFLNPLGYDLVVYGINYLTNDYWLTMRIMYALAGIFFIMFLFLYEINPIKAIKNQIRNTQLNLKRKNG